MADEVGVQDRTTDTLAREALRLRLSMMLINDLMKQREFRIPLHLALGHEAIAVAVAAAMDDEDRLLLTHRNIHYNLARNPDLERQIEEYRLGEGGLGGGRYGGMNLINPAGGIAYTSSILGNCLPVAVGVAKARAKAGIRAATVAITGDGAMEEGAFYEALMMARSLALPVVFLVENNEWSMYSRIEERRCPLDLEALAGAFDVPYQRLAGNDAAAYCTTLQALRARAVERGEPCVVEVLLSTLGDWHVEEEGRAPRHINYHHGAVPWLSYDDDPVLQASERDPLHVLAARYPGDAWAALVAAGRAALPAGAA